MNSYFSESHIYKIFTYEYKLINLSILHYRLSVSWVDLGNLCHTKKLIWEGCRDGSVCNSAGLCKPEDLSSNSECPGRKAVSTSLEWAQVDSGGLVASQPNWSNELLTQWGILNYRTEAENKASGVFLSSQHVHAEMPVPAHTCGQCVHIHINTFWTSSSCNLSYTSVL